MFNDSGSGAIATAGHDTGDSSGRLPTNVLPTHYNLTLTPDFEDFTFSGSVEILLDVAADSESITLHSLNLEILEPRIQHNARTVDVLKVTYDQDTQTAKLVLSEVLHVGRGARLVMKFSGKLTEDANGIYLAKYGDHEGKVQYVLVSQMEPVDCRRAFPCFDEPALKATFDTTMIVDKAFTCLTNMDVRHVEDVGKDLKKWVFNTTPPMSTYILAFAAGNFDMIETNSFRVPVRVYATPNQYVERSRFALEVGAKTLQFFEDRLGLPFPLPKMDMVAAPHFQGAMENWGLVIYDERAILVDEKTSDRATVQAVLMYVQHELAHQWFGNIVTMEYWDGLWLNESFATWAALYGNDHFYPEWKMWQYNLADEYTRAFELDSLRSSHPVEVPVRRASEINQIFDAISYSKGSCILRMITKYIGEEIFLEGVRKYLKKHEYGNTKTDDLWDALTKESNKDIRAFGDVWTRHVGHPIITVTEDKVRIKFTQNRFLRTGDVRDSEDTALYPIFLGVRTSEGVDDGLAFDQRETTIPKTDDLFKINADSVGLYRTLYQPERLEKLIAAKAWLTGEDRFGLVSDAVALAASGHQRTTQALRLIEHFNDASEYFEWRGIAHAMTAIRAAWVFEDDKVQNALTRWQLRVLSSKAHEVGWKFDDSDSHVTQKLKVVLFEAAVHAGDERAVKAALDMWTKYKNGERSAINGNIVTAVYVAALTHGDNPDDAYQRIRTIHRTAKSGIAKRIALTALGSARRPELVQETLQLLLTDEVSELTLYLPFHELCKFKEGLRASLKWLKENFDAIQRRLAISISMLDLVLLPVVGNIVTDEDLKDVQAFFETKSTDAYKNQLEQALDEARVKIGWVNRDREEVKHWLETTV